MTDITLDSIERAYTIPGWRLTARLILALLAVVLIWSHFAKLDEVTVAVGQVVPEAKVKVVQHLEGGIVSAILVHDGDTVTAGQPLIRLTLGTGGIDREELAVRQDALVLTRARLAAEAAGQSPAFPAAEAGRRPDLAAAETATWRARANERASQREMLSQQVRQRQQELAELAARRKAANANLDLARKKLAMSAALVDKGYISRLEHIRRQGEVETVAGEVASLSATEPRLQSTLAEARKRLDQEQTHFTSETRDTLGLTEREIARIRELQAKAGEQQDRTIVRSPIDGVVKSLKMATIGGVVRPGEPILEVVPSGGPMVIETKLPPAERGYIEVGQKAVVKVTTYEFRRFGGIDGRVLQVAPDTEFDAQGHAFFLVTVAVDRPWVGSQPGLHPLLPGMQASVDIHTGERSVLNFLLKPIVAIKDEGFRER